MKKLNHANSKVEISVIIPCFNAEKWIREAIQSVLAQNLSSLEIIAIDDGSTDSTGTVIEREFPFVHLIRVTKKGPSRARNIGTKESNGEFIQYLDADDMLAPGKLRIQLETLKKTGADIAYGDWQTLKETKNGIWEKGKSVKRSLKDPIVDLFTFFWCPPAVYLFRRTSFENVGGWNEGLPVAEDARFVQDCALNGCRFVYCPGIMAYYRQHRANSLSKKDAVGFVRTVYKNALEIETILRNRGNINRKEKKALLEVYGCIARASFEKDKATFEAAYKTIKKLTPYYVPMKPIQLAIASLLLGYRRAERLAFSYRKAKQILRQCIIENIFKRYM